MLCEPCSRGNTLLRAWFALSKQLRTMPEKESRKRPLELLKQCEARWGGIAQEVQEINDEVFSEEQQDIESTPILISLTIKQLREIEESLVALLEATETVCRDYATVCGCMQSLPKLGEVFEAKARLAMRLYNTLAKPLGREW